LLAWNWPWWAFLYHRNGKTLQIRAFTSLHIPPPPEPIARHLPTHHYLLGWDGTSFDLWSIPCFGTGTLVNKEVSELQNLKDAQSEGRANTTLRVCLFLVSALPAFHMVMHSASIYWSFALCQQLVSRHMQNPWLYGVYISMGRGGNEYHK
jgi:hypothetical protein